MTLKPGMPSATGSAEAEKNLSVSSGKSAGTLAGREAGDSVVGRAGAGVVASCPAASCCPGPRRTHIVATRATHKATDATSVTMRALTKRRAGRASSGLRATSCGSPGLSLISVLCRQCFPSPVLRLRVAGRAASPALRPQWMTPPPSWAGFLPTLRTRTAARGLPPGRYP
jgi:hypothetical protein